MQSYLTSRICSLKNISADRKTVESKKAKCYKIYCDEFGKDYFSEKLFEICFEDAVWLETENEPVALLFLLPCEIICDSVKIYAKYVFAVTTVIQHRKKGYMRFLLKSVADICKDSLLFLRPANEDLITYYEKFGYKAFTAQNKREGDRFVLPIGSFAEISKGFENTDGKEYTAMYYSDKKYDLDSLCFPFAME